MKRAVTWVLMGAVLAGVGAAVTAAPSAATPASGLAINLLARGTDASHGTIPLKFKSGTDIAMTQITVQPGGSSGWHSHPGGAIIVVKEGTLTVYRSVGRRCEATTYTAGQAFIERPREVDNVLNAGSTPYVLYVTFPSVPPGDGVTGTRNDEDDPGTCPGI